MRKGSSSPASSLWVSSSRAAVVAGGACRVLLGFYCLVMLLSLLRGARADEPRLLKGGRRPTHRPTNSSEEGQQPQQQGASPPPPSAAGAAAAAAIEGDGGMVSGADTYACGMAPSVKEDRRVNKDRLRVVTYNAEWLFLDQSSKGPCPGSGCAWPNASKAREHAQAVGQVLRQLDADVVNLCEVEGCDELQYLQESLLPDLRYRHYLVRGGDTVTGQNVGLLSRLDPLLDLARDHSTALYPVPGSTCFGNSSSRQQPHPGGKHGASKHYHTALELAGTGLKVALVAAHLLALPYDKTRCMEREAQATVLRAIVDRYLDSGYEVLCLGDFNDFDPEVPDVNSHVPISQALYILKHGGSGRQPLVNAAQAIADQAQRYTDWYDANGDCKQEVRELSMIDHVLLSPGLAQRLTRVWIDTQAYTQACGTNESDHWPVVVEFNTSAAFTLPPTAVATTALPSTSNESSSSSSSFTNSSSTSSSTSSSSPLPSRLRWPAPSGPLPPLQH